MSIFFDMECVRHGVKKIDISQNAGSVNRIGTCQNSCDMSITIDSCHRVDMTQHHET
jgi:hypothetical protein